MLADASDAITTLHSFKCINCQPSEIAVHSSHHLHENASDYAHHAHNTHHSVIDIPMPSSKSLTPPSTQSDQNYELINCLACFKFLGRNQKTCLDELF